MIKYFRFSLKIFKSELREEIVVVAPVSSPETLHPDLTCNVTTSVRPHLL